MPHVTGTMLVGMGAVGSHLIGPLAALLANDPNCCPIGDNGKAEPPPVVLIDGDEFEEKNLRNQCISTQDVGMNKADWAATLVAGLVDADPWPRFITGPLEVQSWLVSQRSKQAAREEAGLFGGVAIIVIPVDNDHARWCVYKALDECPNTNVLVVDPSNGAGEDADEVDIVTYLRVYDPSLDQCMEPWPSPMVKFAQLRNPGPPPKRGTCAEAVVSEPQLRTSNMLAATLTYDCIERFLNERGMPEGYAYSDEHLLRRVGDALATQAQMAHEDELCAPEGAPALDEETPA